MTETDGITTLLRRYAAEVLTAEQMKSWETNAAAWRAELLKTFGHREGDALATAGESPPGGS
jgi:hypothetical protein